MSIAAIKNAIKTNLDELVTAEVLGAVTIADIRKDPLDADIAPTPHAFLMPPSTEAVMADNRSNIRKYTFEILVVVNAENLTSTTELEEMIEDILDKFDNDPTLGGTALGGMTPLSTAPMPSQHNGKDTITVDIVITAQEFISLTFS